MGYAQVDNRELPECATIAGTLLADLFPCVPSGGYNEGQGIARTTAN